MLALNGFRSTLARSISVVLASNICSTTIAALRAFAVTLGLSTLVATPSLSLRGTHPSFDPPTAVACRERRFPRALALPARQAFASLKLTKPVHVRHSRTGGMRDASHESERRLRGPGRLDERAICGLPNETHANSSRAPGLPPSFHSTPGQHAAGLGATGERQLSRSATPRPRQHWKAMASVL